MYNKYNYSVLGFFCLILLLPFIGIFSKITYDLESIIEFLTNSYTHRIIYFSLYQAFLSAFISCFLAIPLATLSGTVLKISSSGSLSFLIYHSGLY